VLYSFGIDSNSQSFDLMTSRDPAKSLPFYTDLLGFTLIDKFDFPQYQFCIYMLTSLPQGVTYDLIPGSQEAHDYTWSMEGVALELTHNYGTEDDTNFQYHPGNADKDGFGHIAVNVDDVYAASEKL
jgi:lactoylglutathione lyase